MSPSATTSGTALTRVATTGRPASIASSRTIPNPSQRDVWTKTSARSSQSRMSVRPGRSDGVAEVELGDELSRLRLERAGAEDRQASLGDLRRTRANARSSVA